MSTDVRSFMEILFEDKPSDLYILVWVLQGKESHWFQNVDGAIEFIEAGGRHDLFVGVGLSTEDRGPYQRCKCEEIVALVGLWADVDLKSAAHTNPALPATVEAGRQILPEKLPPTLIVETGNGFHAWWKFKEPFVYENDEDRRAAEQLSNRWQTMLKYRANENGLAFDRLADAARVLRIQGTENIRNPCESWRTAAESTIRATSRSIWTF